MSDIVDRLRARRALASSGFGRTNSESVWLTYEPDEDCQQAADEIENLRRAVRHESDCVEAAKDEIERLRAEVERLKAHEARAMRDPDACNGTMIGTPPTYTPICLSLRAEVERLSKDAARLDWIERAAKARKIEIAESILRSGFEIGEWPSMRVTVRSGSLREVLDAAMAQENKNI